ncbi:hypothetical protein TNIN_232231 [Trichonephila inaurata madagascariensis]|uniref:Uncharacterized protein n=1 Tax=Trichonephila inaurata madagascariensis TaxID=2747483 RepID=A0A8X7CG21_9ARAC|nr:hypothetical protein TNIN_232231 [Trichonephila inaurata madagascariensis]
MQPCFSVSDGEAGLEPRVETLELPDDLTSDYNFNSRDFDDLVLLRQFLVCVIHLGHHVSFRMMLPRHFFEDLLFFAKDICSVDFLLNLLRANIVSSHWKFEYGKCLIVLLRRYAMEIVAK